MPDDDAFDEVMARLRTGDAEAAARVFHRFANRRNPLAAGVVSRPLEYRRSSCRASAIAVSGAI